MPKGEPSGVIRAFDAVNGKLIWFWDMGRPPATRPVGAGETYTRGTRAFDIKSGKTLWSFHLPAGSNATPITYMGNEGRQYVVIAAGDHGGI